MVIAHHGGRPDSDGHAHGRPPSSEAAAADPSGAAATERTAEALSVVFVRVMEAYFSWKVWRERSKTLNTFMLPQWVLEKIAAADKGAAGKYTYDPTVVVSPTPVVLPLMYSQRSAQSRQCAYNSPPEVSTLVSPPHGDASTGSWSSSSAYAEMFVLRLLVGRCRLTRG